MSSRTTSFSGTTGTTISPGNFFVTTTVNRLRKKICTQCFVSDLIVVPSQLWQRQLLVLRLSYCECTVSFHFSICCERDCISSYFVGNLLQGFSSGGWKEQHNIHHAATNVVGRDGDLELMPLWATVVQDLKVGYVLVPSKRRWIPISFDQAASKR